MTNLLLKPISISKLTFGRPLINCVVQSHKKENTKAAILPAIKKELRGKVDINELNKILAEIMEQAVGQYSDWPRVG